MDGALTFSVFYAAFLLITLTLFSTMPIEAGALKGLTQAQIDSITGNASPPEAPDILTAILWPLISIGGYIGNLFLLLSVSSAHQFLAILIGIFSFGELMVIISIIRGN